MKPTTCYTRKVCFNKVCFNMTPSNFCVPCLPLHAGFNGVFVPLLVDDLHRFLAAFESHDFWGFSCTIPHKEAAFQAASSSAGCDPVAAQIGAVNTLIREPAAAGSSSSKASWRGYNTDWLAAISAIERVLAAGSSDAAAVTSSSGSSDGSSPLQGKTVCVVGAGGAGRALAFGAVSKGAKVIIANR
jgi:3-dehydroquinate dehydratase/shikimate dehydrogenase